MLRKIVQEPRCPSESYVEWIVRATHRAEEKCREHGVHIWLSEQRRRYWRWAGHVARIADARWTAQILDFKPAGRRRVGRPVKRWADEVSSYCLRHFGENWRILAQSRDDWKAEEASFAEAHQ